MNIDPCMRYLCHMCFLQMLQLLTAVQRHAWINWGISCIVTVGMVCLYVGNFRHLFD